MTLRLRLVVALVALAAAGLAVFAVVTYSLYARSRYQRLDEQVRSSAPLVTRQLVQEAGVDPESPPAGAPDDGRERDDGRPGPPPPPVRVPPGTYGELRDDTGARRGNLQLTTSTALPDLSDVVPEEAGGGRLVDTGSVGGSGRWRVYTGSPEDLPEGWTVIVAVPSDEVASSLNRLVVIEATAGLALLALLGAGSWLILRHGLRPLERMAQSAATITSGDLSQRVDPSDGRTEVGQLGLALNTMLGEIEAAFLEREVTEAKLRQFLSDASHELRTPLTSIQGFAELFRMGAEHDHVDLAVILRRIEEETARMRVLVDDLLLLARLDETRPVEREPVDLAVLAADACSDAVAADPARPVTLDAPRPVVVLGDRDHLRQAIANLVANAVRHTPHGSALEVTARTSDGTALVSVRDHGAGLDAEGLAHVFDRFWQADRARVGVGSGLGLSIVAGIAHEHGGRAVAENAAGGGAVFTLRLPNGPVPDRPRSMSPDGPHVG